MKKEKSCGAIVFYIKDGKEEVLLIKHSNSGHWSFPKGHVEKNETEEQTAAREIKEETGITVDIDKRFREVVTYSPKKETVKDVVYFFAIAKDYKTQRQVAEVDEVKWETLDNVLNIVSYRNDKSLIESAIKFFKQNYKGENL